MANFLEQLVAEWYEYRGYFIRRNVCVGKLPQGGHECELDVIVFHPGTKHLVHIEPSTDADSWQVREQRFKKKFDAGRKYIAAMFPGVVDPSCVPEQIALLVFASKEERSLGGGTTMHVSTFLKQMTSHLAGFPMIRAQVPEQFTVLRTLQFVVEYRKLLFTSS